MKSKPAPAFQFYPGDWLSSTKVALMSLAEQGAYIRLLCHAWADPDCSLPNDDKVLAKLSGLGRNWHKKSGSVIKSCFKLHQELPNRLINIRLLNERQKQENYRKQQRSAGEEGAKRRWQKGIEFSPVKEGDRVAMATPSSKNSNPIVSPLAKNGSSFSSSTINPPPIIPPPEGDNGGGGNENKEKKPEINSSFSTHVRERLKEFKIFTDLSCYEERDIRKAIAYVSQRRHTLASPGGALVAWLQKHGHVRLDLRGILSQAPRGP